MLTLRSFVGRYSNLSGVIVSTAISPQPRNVPQAVEQGASIVGGCCGIGPEHIARLHRDLLPAANPTLSQGNG